MLVLHAAVGLCGCTQCPGVGRRGKIETPRRDFAGDLSDVNGGNILHFISCDLAQL